MTHKNLLNDAFIIMMMLSFISCQPDTTGQGDKEKQTKRGNYVNGPEIDNWTEEIKEQQREHGDEFLQQLGDAIRNKDGEIILEHEHYRFPLDRVYVLETYTPKRSTIEISGVDGLTIDGNGATFWFEHYRTGISLQDCKNITLKNLTMDWDPLPFTQGTVIGIDPEGQYVDVETDKDFLSLTEMINHPSLETWPRLKFFAFDAQTGLIKPRMMHSRIEKLEVLGNRKFRLYSLVWGGLDYAKMNLEVGDAFAVVMRHATGVRQLNCHGITWENVKLYSSPFIGSTFSGLGSGLVLRNCELMPRPGTKRLMGCNADVLHCVSAIEGPVIENCKIGTTGDDLINIHGCFNLVQKQVDHNKILISYKSVPNISVGSTLNIYDYNTMEFRGSAKVISIEQSRETIPDAKEVARENRIISFGGNHSTLCELDRALKVSRGDLVESDMDEGRGSIIRGCSFHNSTTNGLLIAARGVLIENNTFSYIDYVPVSMKGSTNWCEGPFPADITIRGNTFENVSLSMQMTQGDDTNIGAICVTPYYRGELRKNFRPDHNIVISDNQIKDCSVTGIMVCHTRNAEITGNEITNYCMFTSFAHRGRGINAKTGIYIGDCEDVTIANNTLSKGQYAEDFITVGKYVDPSTVKLENNTTD